MMSRRRIDEMHTSARTLTELMVESNCAINLFTKSIPLFSHAKDHVVETKMEILHHKNYCYDRLQLLWKKMFH